jgi:molybdopterin converting factor small subunit
MTQTEPATITVQIEVWSSLSHLFGLQRARRTIAVEAPEGTTLQSLMHRLSIEYPCFGKFFYKPGTSEPNGRVSVVVNNRLPELLTGDATILQNSDCIVLVQAYEGGSYSRFI